MARTMPFLAPPAPEGKRGGASPPESTGRGLPASRRTGAHANAGVMSGFDNRGGQRQPGFAPVGAHFHLRIGPQRIVFCYIRKNACSAIKRLFERTSPRYPGAPRAGDTYDFMSAEHRLKRGGSLSNFDRSIFIYRDPVERMVSLYKNKFVMRDGCDGIFERFRKDVGRSPERATFREFVFFYLTDRFDQLDRHVAPQAHHLRSDHYTDAVALAELHPRMAEMFGLALADEIFLIRLNSTSHFPAIEQFQAFDVPADVLAAAMDREGGLPETAEFLNDHIVGRLHALYEIDFAMIRAIETAR